MLRFANHILAVAYENNLSVSNLQLQKVMYFAMREQKANRKLLLQMYNEPFYVWRYGPVVPSIYRKYKGYGSRAIIEKGERNSKFSIFDNVIIYFLNKEPFSLVEKSCTHRHWLVNKDRIFNGMSGIKYKLKDVLD